MFSQQIHKDACRMEGGNISDLQWIAASTEAFGFLSMTEPQ